MKRLRHIFAVFLIVAGCASPESQDLIDVSPTNVELGDTVIGQKKEFSIWLKNNTSEDARIKDLRYSCTCLSIESQNRLIEKGSSIELRGVFVSPGITFTKRVSHTVVIEFESNEIPPKMVQVGSDVIKGFDLAQQSIAFSDESREATVCINRQSLPVDLFKNIAIEELPDGLTADFQKANEQIAIKFKLHKLDALRHPKRIQFSTANKMGSLEVSSLLLTCEQKSSAIRPNVFFARVFPEDLARSSRKSFELKSVDEKPPPQVVSIHCSDNRFEFGFSQKKDGSHLEIWVSKMQGQTERVINTNLELRAIEGEAELLVTLPVSLIIAR